MPSTEGLEILVRKRQPTEKQWLELTEARRNLLKPHLNSLTLSELGHFECLRSEGFKHAIAIDAPKVIGDERFSLKTQGIFHMQPYSAVERISPKGCFSPERCPACKDGTMQVWGVTRSGLWVLVAIDFVGECGYKDRGYERAEQVNITEVDLPVIIERTKEKPENIWEALGNTVKVFADHRRRLFMEVENLEKMIMIEELALSLIPG